MAKLGKPLDLSDEELDDLSTITNEDVERVQKKFRKTSKRWSKNLLLASQSGEYYEI